MPTTSPISSVNNFVVRFANVNGSGSASANEMFARTSTELAPWTLVAANDKRHARLVVLDTICDRLERALKDV